jgi:transposase
MPEGGPMMGEKAIEPKLYLNFSLDSAVPANHLVRRLAAAVDLTFVRGLTRRYYSSTGKPSVDPVVLFKLVLLGYLFNITSERRLCEEAGLNLAWRWFLGYELDEPIPDHSVLSKARRRFGPTVYERFFQRIVELCEARGLIQGDVLFVDATLTRANASPQSLRSRALLEHRLREPKRFVAELWTVNEPDTEDDVPPPKKMGRPRTRDPKHLRSRSVTNELSVSPTDPDAQMFRKLGKTALLCHKTHMAVDGGKANIITAVEVRPSCEADSHVVSTMLVKHHVNVGRPAREIVGDKGYGSEAAYKACTERGVAPTLAMRSLNNRLGIIRREEFTYVAARDIFICPQGRELRRFGHDIHGRTSAYRAVRGTCSKCVLKPQCAPGVADRSITRRWDGDLWSDWEHHLRSRRSRRMLRHRQAVSERIFALGKDNHGLARAQFRGRANMRIQALLTAATLNVKQLVRRRPVPQEGAGAIRMARTSALAPS